MSGGVKKPYSYAVLMAAMTSAEKRLSDKMIRRELLTFALAWYVRRAQKLGADVLPLFSNGPERVDLWLKQHKPLGEEATDQRAADLLRYYRLIPPRRTPGPKKTFSKRVMKEHLLRKFRSLLREARWIHRQAPRNLTNAGAISRTTEPPGAWPELCEIVALARVSSSMP